MKKKIKKIDAALSQIDTAIELWFRNADSIAIHTLSSAAHQIIHDIVAKRNGPDLLFNSLVFKEEYRNSVIDAFRAPQNFFKHADRDPSPEGEIEFEEELSEAFIMFSLQGLEWLGVPYNLQRSAISQWFCINRPEMMTEKGKKQYSEILRMKDSGELPSIEKGEFYELYKIAYKRQNPNKAAERNAEWLRHPASLT